MGFAIDFNFMIDFVISILTSSSSAQLGAGIDGGTYVKGVIGREGDPF